MKNDVPTMAYRTQLLPLLWPLLAPYRQSRNTVTIESDKTHYYAKQRREANSRSKQQVQDGYPAVTPTYATDTDRPMPRFSTASGA